MKTTLLCLLLSSVALAAGPRGGPGGGGPPDPAMREQMEKRARVKLIVGLSEALELNEAEALKMGERLRSFEARRKPLRDELHESMKLLRSAASGDQAALSQVDAATGRALEVRIKLAALDKEQFALLAKDLSPQRKAQLALFMARFGHGGPGGPGRQGPGGPGMHGPGPMGGRGPQSPGGPGPDGF